jgi:hypothetical protein
MKDADVWTHTVRTFHNYDIYYLPQYARSFSLHGDGEPLCLYYEDGGTRAVNVVMKRDISQCAGFDIPPGEWFDTATPYGYGGFLIEGDTGKEALHKLDAAYCAWAQSEGIVSEFVRFHPLLKNHCGMEEIYTVTELGKTISMDLSSPAVIFANMTPQARNKMRKAQANGIEIRFGTEQALFDAFKEMYDATMRRKNAQPYYFFGAEFYKSICEDLKGNAVVAYAVFNGETIAMAILLHANEKLHGHLEASKEETVHLAPIVLLVAEAALWGHGHGMKTLHFGGGVGAQGDSLYTFKKSFNKNSDNQFAIGKKVFDTDKYDFLLRLHKKINGENTDPDFFPQYRAR